MNHPVYRRVVAGATLVLATAACSSSGDEAASSTNATTSASSSTTAVVVTTAAVVTTVPASTITAAPTTTLAVPPGSRYVAMGSSYAAGAGIPTQLDPTCERSDSSYPSLVSVALGLELVDVSCGGATIPNLLETSNRGQAPQIDGLTAETALVTITAGGNDLGYVIVAGACGNGEAPCTVDAADLQANATALVANLHRLFDAIRERSPEATIVFVTYPTMVTDTVCPALNFEPDEAEVFGNVATTLQNAFLTATADQARLILVDPYSAGSDHGACAPEGESWINGNAPATGKPYHPTPAEHLAVSEMIVDALGA